MRYILLTLSSLITIALIYVLDTRKVLPAPLGKLLSPQHGIWQNAEPADMNFSADFSTAGLKGKVDIYLDDRLVPHVFAEQENDAYFAQGYLHARFRLWQMELQTHAAAGRVSEILGSKGLHHDREFRRLGMGYAAEQSLKEMEKDPMTKAALDAYTAGVNYYINSLRPSQLPVEYKLIGYTPEQWSNLKSAQFLKYMSYDLAGRDDDFEMTNAHQYFSKEDFDLLYPLRQDSLDPIIPKGTVWKEPAVKPVQPAIADSLYFNNKELLAYSQTKPDRDNGSNNWAVAPFKTKNKAPILCNDPHLGLNLPSLWYEIQLSTPAFNSYGVSFPGAPGVIIGYNDSCAFGFTNGGRDVKDYYKIQFKDASRKEYWFNNAWHKTEFRVEKIGVRDSLPVIDSVAYTVFGPVMFEPGFGFEGTAPKGYYALRWTAHDPSNELKMFFMLNRAKNYADYLEATKHLLTPGQNCIFACKNGDIALRTQGNWPAKWKGQGDFVMPGTDSSFMWQGMIPWEETPMQYNPERGFVSSANQHPADSTYPYFLGRNYPIYRGIMVNKLLSNMQEITTEDMKRMQSNNHNVFAEMAIPRLVHFINDSGFSKEELGYLDLLKKWDFDQGIESRGATIFKIFWDKFYDAVYADEFKNAPSHTQQPFESTLLEAILRDSTYKFIDDVGTPGVETLNEKTTMAFKDAIPELQKIEQDGRLEWARFKSTRINHLAKLDAFSSLNLPIGGGTHIINATKETHGPSWRMVIGLSTQTEAFGIYPGGQQGNPGSRFYDNFVYDWANGRHYTLWLMRKEEANDKRVKWTIHFNPSNKG